jgi:mRNA interferase MazF
MPIEPKRGEVWRVDFEPTRGSGMRKTRPAVVMNVPYVGRLPLRFVVPLTGWNDGYASFSWMTRPEAEPATGLTKPSAADAFQARSVDLSRFEERLGVLPEPVVARIAAAIALTVGYVPPADPAGAP